MEKQEFKTSHEGPSEKGHDSLKDKLKKGAVVLAAFTALAGEACSPDRGNEVGQTGGRSKSVQVEKEQMKPNSVLLAEYYKNIHEGNFPSKGQSQRIVARALEIAVRKGIRIGKGSRVSVEARGTVPVKIEIDGQPVPVGPNDYIKEELDLVKLVEEISASMGNAPDRTSSNTKSGGKIYTSPDFEDFLGGKDDLKSFLDNDNKPEKRKSKSDF